MKAVRSLCQGQQCSNAWEKAGASELSAGSALQDGLDCVHSTSSMLCAVVCKLQQVKVQVSMVTANQLIIAELLFSQRL